MKKFKEFMLIKESTQIMDQYNSKIDYTLLDNNTSDDEIVELCEKATKFGVKSVCVMPKHVNLAAETLEDSSVLVCTVISFPEGTNTLQNKIKETEQVIRDGADEVDMVLNYPHLIDKWNSEYWEEDGIGLEPDDYDFFCGDGYGKTDLGEISALVNICHANINKEGEPIILKVIVESGLLTPEQTETATLMCEEADADFIKTSTGKVSQGAEISKVKIMYDIIQEMGSDLKIKASGGVRTMQDLQNYENFVDRYGMGFGAVDTLNGLDSLDQGY